MIQSLNAMITEYFPTLAITAAALAALWLGMKLAALPGKMWRVAVAVPLTLLTLTAITLNFRQLAFIPPTSWLSSGSGRWISITLSVAMLLSALSARVKKAGERRVLFMLAGVVILRAGTLPFLGPVLFRNELETMQTVVDGKGVCIQSTYYNCGPASAVTALRRLGFEAEEGAIGLLCKTDGISGTPDDTLAEKLAQRYGPEGLIVEHRYLKSLDELRASPVSIAVIRFNLFTDHYVTILGFVGDKVIIGDPLSGETTLPVAEFEKSWRHAAIILSRRRH